MQCFIHVKVNLEKKNEVLSGRLQEVKNKGKFQTLSSKSGTTVVAYGRWLLARGSKYSDLIWKFWCFGKLVAEERWLLRRGGRNRRFDCI